MAWRSGGQIPAALAPSVLGASLGVADAEAKVQGDDTAWAGTSGCMLNLSPATRFGLSYRSSIKYTVEGDVSFNIRRLP
jgi:long-chain fatty acid transport protein